MDNDTSAPSWWDRLYPSYAAYAAAMEEVLPPFVPIGPVPLPREVVQLGAWFTPGGQSGLYTRLALSAREAGLGWAGLNSMWSAVEDQASAAGFGDGGGFGGSFGWTAERTSMAQLIIPNTYRVAIEAVSGGQAITNVVGVSAPSGNALGAATAVQTAWKVAAGPLTQLRPLYSLLGFRSLDLSSPNGGIAFVADTAAGTSGATTNSTNAASALVKWNGGTRSRSARGRLYFGPLAEAQIENDGRTLNAAARTAINTAFTNFRNSLSASGFPLVVISQVLAQTFPVTQNDTEPIIATQRRRIRS